MNAYTKEYWALFQQYSGCYHKIRGTQLHLNLRTGFFPLEKHVCKKRHAQKSGNGTETQTEILETVIRLQHIFIRALMSSDALKT